MDLINVKLTSKYIYSGIDELIEHAKIVEEMKRKEEEQRLYNSRLFYSMATEDSPIERMLYCTDFLKQRVKKGEQLIYSMVAKDTPIERMLYEGISVKQQFAHGKKRKTIKSQKGKRKHKKWAH